MFVSVKICDNREFVKQLFNVLMKFRGKIISTLGAACILKKWGPNTTFYKNGLRNQILCMQSREMETKNK